MHARRFSATLTSVALAAAFSFACSSSSNNPADGAAGTGGHDAGAAGHDAGAAGDASAGSAGA
ncbi:MAG: hypothetical protein JWM82_2311, partial [Myxococcales bacterium]|nr:hypothetical protein [Myxococcales bacterium]